MMRTEAPCVEPQAVGREPAWTRSELANPHAVESKSRRVRAMFSAIAPRYDLNNRLHSLGRDQAWRRLAVRLAQVRCGQTVLDVACGTGDLALAFSRTQARRVLGVDFTFDMLALAQRKRAHLRHTQPSYQAGDAMRLPVADASVDVVSIAFGIRNVDDPAVAMSEFYRVLRPGGRLVVLEFSQPANPLWRGLYHLYFHHIMPRTAALVAGDRSGAYRYLPRSVSTFLNRQAMVNLMASKGFEQIFQRPLSLGIAVIYRGVKPGGGASDPG